MDTQKNNHEARNNLKSRPLQETRRTLVPDSASISTWAMFLLREKSSNKTRAIASDEDDKC